MTAAGLARLARAAGPMRFQDRLGTPPNLPCPLILGGGGYCRASSKIYDLRVCGFPGSC
jgi:hypothetical protein